MEIGRLIDRQEIVITMPTEIMTIIAIAEAILPKRDSMKMIGMRKMMIGSNAFADLRYEIMICPS
jgi:hypothetical protein